MQKVISKYATAAHLAILAVAPLLLLPLIGPTETAIAVGWLALFTVIWVIMEPSRRAGEMLHNSRQRVAGMVRGDPLFWFSAVVVVYVCIRAFNGGIGLAYDAEMMIWTIRTPTFEILPGCVSGTGWFPLAVVLSLAIVFQGVRHTLGRSARSAFLLIVSTLSSVAALVMIVALSYGERDIIALATLSYHNASFVGTAFGIATLIGLVAMFATIERKWMRAEPVAVVALVLNLTAMVVFAPPLTVAVFLLAYVILAAVSFVTMRSLFEGSASFRCALAILISLGAPVLYCFATADAPFMADRIVVLRSGNPFPAWYWQVRNALSEASLVTWKENPWIGTGLGSFPLDIRFALTDADWSVVAPNQVTTLNGWWLLLVERGVTGALILAVGVGMLAWTFVSRLVASFTDIRLTPELFLGPVVLAVAIALMFFDCSVLRPETMLLIGAALAFSGGALPERVGSNSEGKDC